MLIFDGHLDLAMNALGYERDQRLTVEGIRNHEANAKDDGRETPTASLEEMRLGGVAGCVATVIARAKPVKPQRGATRRDLDYPTQEMAYAAAKGQLAYYEVLERQGTITIVRTADQLAAQWAQWEAGDDARPTIVIISMEGADPLVEPEDVHLWWQQGLRTLILAHTADSVYAYGTPQPHDVRLPIQGPLTEKGRRLLAELTTLSTPLDLTHLCDVSFFETIERYPGPVYTSHTNCRALVPGMRQLSDEQLRIVLDREGVIGIALCNPMLRPGTPETLGHNQVGLDAVAEHIDHVCQLAGDAMHTVIGSDLDGGFGREWVPREIDTIADLPRIGEALAKRGYPDADIKGVLHGNWLRFWKRVLPK